MGEEEFSTGDVYRPPVAAAERPVVADNDLAPHYVVSLRKLVALYVATLGLYQIVWFAKHWRCYRDKTSERILPVARGIFSIFFAHRLFEYIKQRGAEDVRVREWNANASATAYVALLVVGRISDRLSMQVDVFSVFDVIGFGLFFACMFPLQAAQRAANISSGDTEGRSNDSFSAGNFIAMVVGLLVWAMILFAIFLPPVQ
jgi:hypothetical protein